ncbi:uncharacterized protein OCT59_024420 [Rhizophagus irregularis]|uniref:Uncharacterized protein n=2 Tax=Rhizophagus irregularis TaxID=588596 RepID=A0A015J1Z0_RHIIW|nr:hypothetical protein GLOIN_2v1781418 [Rhizophagus irregularis DAOM 181602=DAOM 197198]EXX63517.1 hypothetical protein RirG_151660 [Rhizophagus irregularis DAOM 197198w]POG65672.1 hypothetical protein GLOIN_2v1781418 [Rhizophagus irregularis DAOM 181602=DAOM 197198]UZO04021.1 hypothetical protein OCT59_024420 [Rhizophagus irregularis]|eukprot:XP_025172538.1 hypothetical protein GLOIN_2v1781418 [Rhizophagus irregularis DAOM 181602=DAOM 197198]
MSNYPGQNIIIEYLKERGSKSTYCGFLNFNSDFITASISPTDTCDNLDTVWFYHFLREAKSLFNQKTYIVIKNKVNEEHSRYIKNLQNFWQRIIKEYKKENLVPTITSHFNETSDIKSSEISQPDRIIKEHKKENLAPAVTSHLNKTLNKTSDIKLSEISQPDSNETKKYVEQKGKLKRVRDDSNTDTESLSNEHWKKQSQILKQNKNNLAYVQVIDNALLVASAYESLIENNIIPFIKILKTSLLSRSRMSLSSANEPVLQAIVENLLPLKYCIPELALVTNGKKPKGSGHFGYSDIFILNSEGDNNVILELKYISLVGLINSNQKNNFGANELENLDKILEKENEESVLKRSYTYWSKEEKKTNMTTIGETLNNGLNKLNLYMETISKGKAKNYSSSGVFDDRVKITKSKPNKLKGFVILVIGFRRILWKSANEVTTNHIYNKI